MNFRSQNSRRAFTLIEIMLSLAILTVVMGAIYASWNAVLRAKGVAMKAAAAAQRERMAMRVVEEALSSAQLFVANVNYYGFTNDSAFGGNSSFSFVAKLPDSFPRSGKFLHAADGGFDFDVRRVTIGTETSGDGRKQLVLRQSPILMEMDDDEIHHPVVLAEDVKEFGVEFWDKVKNDWTEDWVLTNELPKLVRVSMQLNVVGARGARLSEMVVREVGLPTLGVQQTWQVPSLSGGNNQRTITRTPGVGDNGTGVGQN